MFLKPYRVKSSNQMKGSDKKRLKLELGKRFPLLSEEDLNGLIPNKEEVVMSKVTWPGLIGA